MMSQLSPGLEDWTTDAMDKAAENDHLETVQYLRENCHDRWIVNTMGSIHQHLSVVHFLHHNRSDECTAKLLDQAIATKHLLLGLRVAMVCSSFIRLTLG